MPRYARLTCQYRVIADATGTRKANLRDNDRPAPDGHVMADLHQIVDLRPFADHGFLKAGPVNGHIGADFDIRTDDHMSNLCYFTVMTIDLEVTKAICSKY